MELSDPQYTYTSTTTNNGMRLRRNCKLRITNNKSLTNNNDESVNGICWIDLLPAELMVAIFENTDFRTRLRAELVSRRWQRILIEQGWRNFTQCRLMSKKYSSSKLLTLFNRCGQNLREIIVEPNSPDDKLKQSRIQIFDWLYLAPNLDTICISFRNMNEADDQQLQQFMMTHPIRCLHLEACLDKARQNLSKLLPLLSNCPALRYLSLTKLRFTDTFAYRIIESSKKLRQLKLDDSIDISSFLWISHNQNPFTELIGLSIHIGKQEPNYSFFFSWQLHYEHMLRRLEQFELAFSKKPNEYAMLSLLGIIPLFSNLRILSLAHIDGQILSEIVRCCPNLEQFEYLAHNGNILPIFPRISQLSKLRVLWVHHYTEAKPKETPEVVKETLRELANNGKLEQLTVNFKLPMELALHIVVKCPRLDYLEYSQAPSNLSSLNSTLNELFKNTSQRCHQLNFRVPYNHWWKQKHMSQQQKQHRPSESSFLQLCYEQPRRETAVMREHLSKVFDDGHIPDFLLRWPKPKHDGGP